MEKIAKSAVELRLNPAHWPAELSRKELSAPFEMNKAIEAANDVFVRFQQAHQTLRDEWQFDPDRRASCRCGMGE